MYNTERVQKFIDRVNDLAEQAAQKVFDDHQEEFKKLVLSELRKGDKLCLVNGSAFFSGRGNSVSEKPLTDAMNSFLDVSQVQYLEQRASFNVYTFEK